jgi:hypothetical protein
METELLGETDNLDEVLEDYDEYDEFDDFDELDDLEYEELDISERARFDRDEFILSLQRDITNGYEARKILDKITQN